MTRFSSDVEKLEPWCLPLDHPDWVNADAAAHMHSDDPVLALEMDGRTWAFPWWMMKNHHIANVTLGGRPVVVILCPMCSSAAAFDPVVDGRTLRFRVGGAYNGTVMPLDYDSGSLWTGFTGEAIEGKLQGRRMTRLPLYQCTWGQWLELFPESLVPAPGVERRDGPGEWHAPGSPLVGPELRRILGHVDARLPHHELVLGVVAGGVARCYPLATATPVLNDEPGGESVVILSRPGTLLSGAFRRRVGDRVLTFAYRDGEIRDAETGSSWSVLGNAVAGRLQGTRLDYAWSGIEEFYVWAAFHPDTDIHRAGAAGSAAVRTSATVDAFPRALQSAAMNKWFKPGARILVLGSGVGMVAAWLAEWGFQVVALDQQPTPLDAVRRSFMYMRNIEFRAGGIGQVPADAGRFDAIVDVGTLDRLAAPTRSLYAADLERLAAAGTRLLILTTGPAEATEQRAERVAQLLRPGFRLVNARIHGGRKVGDRIMARMALRFVQTGGSAKSPAAIKS